MPGRREQRSGDADQVVFGTTQAEAERLGCVVKKHTAGRQAGLARVLFDFAVTVEGETQPDIFGWVAAQVLLGTHPVVQWRRQGGDVQGANSVDL